MESVRQTRTGAGAGAGARVTRAGRGFPAVCTNRPTITAREGIMGRSSSLHRRGGAGKVLPASRSRFAAYIGRRNLPGDPMGLTAPPPATSEKSLLSDMLDVFNVLHDPGAVFNRVKERARILGPWIVLSAAFIVISIVSRPYQEAAMDAFKATLAPEQAVRMGNRGAGGGVVGLILTPLIVLTVRGKAAITGFADVRAPLGLDLLVPSAGIFLGTVLNGINPFSVWAVWLTGTGISITHGISRGAAIAVTAVAYLICLLLLSAPTLMLGMLNKE